MFLSLAAVDIARNAHYKTDVAKPHAPKNQISNGKRRHQEQRNLHDAERFSAWWLSTLPELLITKPTLRNPTLPKTKLQTASGDIRSSGIYLMLNVSQLGGCSTTHLITTLTFKDVP
jgi:hypothetical protein